jgi:hypothetical protein
LLSQLRQFRVLRESRLSFESDATRDDQFGGTAILFHATMTRFIEIESRLRNRIGPRTES